MGDGDERAKQKLVVDQHSGSLNFPIHFNLTHPHTHNFSARCPLSNSSLWVRNKLAKEDSCKADRTLRGAANQRVSVSLSVRGEERWTRRWTGWR